MAALTCQLRQDRKGMMWDLLLYVPTVIFLVSLGAKLWFGSNQTWSYLLVFLASYFAIAGANRIFSTRLMLLPTSPVSLSVDKKQVTVNLRNGKTVDLVKNVRYFSDYAGKSFGLTGMDLEGKRRQYVMHKGQFSDDVQYQKLVSLLRVFA